MKLLLDQAEQLSLESSLVATPSDLHVAGPLSSTYCPVTQWSTSCSYCRCPSTHLAIVAIDFLLNLLSYWYYHALLVFSFLSKNTLFTSHASFSEPRCWYEVRRSMDRTADLGDDGQHAGQKSCGSTWIPKLQTAYTSPSPPYSKNFAILVRINYYHSFVLCFCVFFHQVVTLMKHGYTIDLIW